MPASQLYQLLIANPTKNVDEVKKYAASIKVGVHLTPKELGLLPEQKLQDAGLRRYGQQFDLDAAMWYGAIKTGPYKMFLTKLFHIFYYAGVIYHGMNEGWQDWSFNPFGNVASLLSHGQRVLVQIPTRQKGGDQLWTWLSQPDQIPHRFMATHGQSVLSTPVDLIKGHRQYVEEKKGNDQAVSSAVLRRHYGVNVALGGEGNRNPFSAKNDDAVPSYKPIRADGLNGHVYINYMAPEENVVGGMLVGCENAKSGGKNPHTGAKHGMGAAQKVSACGGMKWSALKCGPSQEYNGFICDLTDRGRDISWLLGAKFFDPDLLDQPTKPLMTCLPAPPKDRLRLGAPNQPKQYGKLQAWET
jgi:hypothetical protein